VAKSEGERLKVPIRSIKKASPWHCVVAQAQLAHCVAWLDPIDDGEMVRQSVANWTEAKVQANMQDQYHTKGSFHGRGANHGQDRDRDHDHEHGQNQGS